VKYTEEQQCPRYGVWAWLICVGVATREMLVIAPRLFFFHNLGRSNHNHYFL